MSAIFGVCFFDGHPVDDALLEKMSNILAHRGPNCASIWYEDKVGLGQRMLLWSTSHSCDEKMPLISENRCFVLTADARLDRRDELIAALDLGQYQADQITDCQLILAAYEKWGERCPEKLFGDFAFAIWDKQRQVFFCARDHFGTRPLYYYFQSGRIFVFGSEIKAILCLPEVPRRVNNVRVGDYLASLDPDNGSTFYDDIFYLPASHRMTVRQDSVMISPYWSLTLPNELRLRSDKEYAEAFRELFTQAVNFRLHSSHPIGLTLSGGQDSSAVCCVARELLKQNGGFRLHTFSLTFNDDPEYKELPFINAVVSQGGVESHYVDGDVSPLINLDQLLWHAEEPLPINICFYWVLCRAIHQQGIRVILDGFGGDQSIGKGTNYLNELADKWRWIKLALELHPLARSYDVQFLRTLWGYIRNRSLSPWIPKPLLHFLRRAQRPPVRVYDKIINPDFARRIDIANRIQAYLDWCKPLKSDREYQHRYMNPQYQQQLLHNLDRITAAFSVEARCPFLDTRLVEFCLSLPPEQKLRRGYDRWIMRRSLADLLPPEVRLRVRKQYFDSFIYRNLLVHERDRLEELIYNDSSTISEYVNIEFLREGYQLRLPPEDLDDNRVWASLALALWLRQSGLSPHT